MALIILARAGQAPLRVTKSSLLDALLLDFKRIAATARAIELLSGETGFSVPFNQVPQRIERDIRAYAESLLAYWKTTTPLSPRVETPQSKRPLRPRCVSVSSNSP